MSKLFTTSINRLCRFSFYSVYIATITKIQFYPMNRKPSFSFKGLLDFSCRFRLCRASSPTACDVSASCRHPWHCCRDQGLRLHQNGGTLKSLQSVSNWNDNLHFMQKLSETLSKSSLSLAHFLSWSGISVAIHLNNQWIDMMKKFRVWKGFLSLLLEALTNKLNNLTIN